MRAIGVKVLKNNLSEYIKLAAGGETILVTDRNRVVAELGPPLPTRSPSVADAQLAELVRTGVVTPPLGIAGDLPRKPVAPLQEMLDDLAAVRADR